MNDQVEPKLTQYSHGAGCGCKLSPAVLEEVLQTSRESWVFPNLIVGNDSRDDAAVFDLGDGRGLISTTDFFLPIVDDPFEFGRIAATNALSDVYAMGGKPIVAIAILGWPLGTLDTQSANRVVEGGRRACADAGIPLAGGHSIDNPEPLFGLAVNGLVNLPELKRNDKAMPGDRLYLTKPLGIGVLSTAQKNGALKPEHGRLGPETMLRLNKVGSRMGAISGVHAMTDVTGFGLLGHLLEICRGSGVSAEINFEAVPVLDPVQDYISQGQIPGGTKRNWNYCKPHVDLNPSDYRKIILADAQTSGGLLISAAEEASAQVEEILLAEGLNAASIGSLGDPRKGAIIAIR